MTNQALLNIQTGYSFKEGFGTIDSVIARLKEMNVQYAGIVDTTTWGHISFYRKCKEAGIQPILGAKAVVSNTDNESKPMMWFLAKNTEGLKELYKLLSKSYRQKMATKQGAIPRLFYEDILQISNNIFVFTGDILDRELLASLAQRRPATTYIELSKEDNLIWQSLKQSLASELRLPILYTDANQYINKEDYLLAKSIDIKVESAKELKIESNEVALQIAMQCRDLQLPKASLPTNSFDLHKECLKNMATLLKNKTINVYLQRLQYEIDIIRTKGFESYFTMVYKLTKKARELGIRLGIGRGSACGSLVCYLLKITSIDPIENNLIFERFIDISRDDPPDIDLDIPSQRKQELLQYLYEDYGYNNVCLLGNVVTYKVRNALQQLCKAYGLDINQFKHVQTTEDIDSLTSQYPELAMVKKLINHPLHSSIHASGILISDKKLSNYCVIDNNNIAHIDKQDIDSLGLLKIDLLSLKTLDMLDSINSVEFASIDLNLKPAFDLINRGEIRGLFQLDGKAVSALVKRAQPTNIQQLSDVIALARTGPIKAGVVSEFLKGRLYPKLIYQEDTMDLVKRFGFNAIECNQIRRFISKAKHNDISHLQAKFLANGASNELWAKLVSMGSWQMCKAHAYSYAILAYICALYKAYYPAQFMASALNYSSSIIEAQDLLREYLHYGHKYELFDPAYAQDQWSVHNGVLYGGFTVFKGCGIHKAKELLLLKNEGKLTQHELNNLYATGSDYSLKSLFPLYYQYKNGCNDITSLDTLTKKKGIYTSIVQISSINLSYGKFKLVLKDDYSSVVSYIDASNPLCKYLMQGMVLKIQGESNTNKQYYSYLDRIHLHRIEFL